MALDLKTYAKETRITDGAWGTELQRRGLPPGDSPELWNVENPDAVEAVARGYIEAGSEIILTNTFGANQYVLARHCQADRVPELAEAGVVISRRTAGNDAKVFASVGPTGKIVMVEEVSHEEFISVYAETASAITRAGPDAIVLETFTELEELALALQAVRQCCDLPVVASMSFTAGPDGTATVMGNQPEELVQIARDYGANAVGANCGIGPDNHVRVAIPLRVVTALPVWIKPNAGVPEIGADGKSRFPVSPEDFADYVPRLVEAGANFIGGCCGTTPGHIRALRQRLSS